MPKISSIVAQKNKKRVNVYVDGFYAFSVFKESLIGLNLFQEKEISKKEIEEIKNIDIENKSMSKAYNLLSYRPRSKEEIRKKLSLKFSDKIVKNTLKELEEKKYLNDEAFVDFWFENRAKSRGVALLRYELFKKGVAAEIIEQKISTHKPEKDLENAIALIKSKGKFKKLEQKEARQKIGSYLARRGYSYDIIKKALRRMYA